jgi:hypothetical protein
VFVAEECWHYEAIGWPRGVMNYPPKFMLMWAERHKLPCAVLEKIKEDLVDGNQVIAMAKDATLAEQFGVDKRTADKMIRILNDKWGSVLTEGNY